MAWSVWALRLFALLGPALVLCWSFFTLPPLRANQDQGLIVLFLAGLIVPLSLLIFLPHALKTLLRHPDLLVPLGVYITLNDLVHRLLSLPLLAAAPQWTWQWSGLAFSLSLSFLWTLAASVLYAGWVTRLIVQSVEEGRVDVLAPLARVGEWFWRVLVVLLLGWVVLFAVLVPSVALAALFLPLGVLVIGVFSLYWNLRTAALLPVVAVSPQKLGAALGAGFRASRIGRRHWWGIVCLHLLLLGWVTVVFASSKSVTPQGTVMGHATTSWNVNGFWAGGYEDSSRWHLNFMGAMKTDALPLISTLLGMLFAVLAVAVKLRIVDDLQYLDLLPQHRRAGFKPVLRPPDLPQDENTDAGEVDLAPQPALVPEPRPSLALSVVGVMVMLGSIAGLVFYTALADQWLLWQYRRAAQAGEPLAPYREHARLRQDPLEFAVLLSEDADALIRAEAPDLLTGAATKAVKRDRPRWVFQSGYGGGFGESMTGLDRRAPVVLKRLFSDADSSVRQRALAAVAQLNTAADFKVDLLKALSAGEVAERVIVAESLAHWERDLLLQTFADPGQPKEVRLAALAGAKKYGWYEIADKGNFQQSITSALDDPDAEVRRAALHAIGHSRAAGSVWMSVIFGKRAEDQGPARDAWVEALVHHEPQWGFLPLESTLAYFSELESDLSAEKKHALATERLALAVHVLCRAALENARILEQTAPANETLALQEFLQNRPGLALRSFNRELLRLQTVLGCLAAARRYACDPDIRERVITSRLPHEAADEKRPPRKLRDYAVEQLRDPLAWCRQNGGRYHSRFLDLEPYPLSRFALEIKGNKGNPLQAGAFILNRHVRSLASVLQDMSLDTDENLQKLVERR